MSEDYNLDFICNKTFGDSGGSSEFPNLVLLNTITARCYVAPEERGNWSGICIGMLRLYAKTRFPEATHAFSFSAKPVQQDCQSNFEIRAELYAPMKKKENLTETRIGF